MSAVLDPTVQLPEPDYSCSQDDSARHLWHVDIACYAPIQVTSHVEAVVLDDGSGPVVLDAAEAEAVALALLAAVAKVRS